MFFLYYDKLVVRPLLLSRVLGLGAKLVGPWWSWQGPVPTAFGWLVLGLHAFNGFGWGGTNVMSSGTSTNHLLGCRSFWAGMRRHGT